MCLKLFYDHIMDELLQWNQAYFSSFQWNKVSDFDTKKITEIYKKHPIVNIRWLSSSKKMNVVYSVLEQENMLEHTFYFHPEQYQNVQIQKASGVKKLLELAEKQKKIRVIVLQDVCQLSGVKQLMKELFTLQRYKIIVVCNGKLFRDIPNYLVAQEAVNFHALESVESEKYKNFLQLWNLFEFDYSQLTQKWILMRNAFVDSVILQDLLISYGVKDILMMRLYLSFIARKVGMYLSIREMHQAFEKWNAKISLITLHEYLQICINVGLLYKIQRYNFKKHTISENKGSYFFADLWIRAYFKRNTSSSVLSHFQWIIVCLCINKWYEIYSWVNGVFEFAFYLKKNEREILVHIYDGDDKKQLRKEIKRLDKVEHEAEKYVIIERFEKLWVRKRNYEWVKLITLEQFVAELSA